LAKIAKNLSQIQIGEQGKPHPYTDEIAILGETRQYHIDPAWATTFPHPQLGPIQILPVSGVYRVDLRRPIYHRALQQLLDQGYREIVVAADGFSLAGALPLAMNLRFILLKTGYTPVWCQNYVHHHPNGKVVTGIEELQDELNRL